MGGHWEGTVAGCEAIEYTLRQAVGLPLSVVGQLHSAGILTRILRRKAPPPAWASVLRHREFQHERYKGRLHGRYIKSILGSLLASLGEALWCLFGHRGWPGVALDAIGMLTFCLFGPCFVQPRFQGFPRAKMRWFWECFLYLKHNK